MIRSYKYLDTAVQLKLHEMVLDFFNRIEFERGEFKTEFFGYSFGLLAKRHREIIRDRLIEIYNQIRNWDLASRTKLFNAIRESNDIEAICKGVASPMKLDNTATDFWALIRDFFTDLYDKVLDGNIFQEEFDTTLRQHFDNFRRLNADITICPVCGINELLMHTDATRDQYDHYLSKTDYPFSSVNFKNLVPICTRCNGLDIKGSTDVVAVASNKKLFFLYDTNFTGLSVEFNLLVDDVNPENIQWQLNFTNPDGYIDEIESWKTIYKIDSRYKGFVNGRIEKWYRHYLAYLQNGKIASLSNEVKNLCYEVYMETDEECHLNFIRMPAFNEYISDSLIVQALLQAQQFSLPATA